MINLSSPDGPDSYRTWADLRNFLLQLVGAPPASPASPTGAFLANSVVLGRFQSENLSRSAEAGSAAHQDFEQMLLVAHYYATRTAARGLAQLVPEPERGQLVYPQDLITLPSSCFASLGHHSNQAVGVAPAPHRAHPCGPGLLRGRARLQGETGSWSLSF